MLYTRSNDRVICGICQHRCSIPPETTGICGTRINKSGKLYSLIYDQISSVACDPVEKKPLFHFYPGSFVHSFGTVSCNFRCDHCQNKSISHVKPGEIATYTITPQRAVEEAISTGCRGIAWTYNEPTIWFEFTYDTAKLAKQRGLYTVYVTNGYLTPEALKLIAPYLDAANVDVKAWTQDFYSKVCGARLEPVLRICELMHKLGIHLEITYLVIPTRNDDPDQIKGFCEWAMGLDPAIPVHFSRFYPFYNPELWQTPIKTLETALEIGYKAGLEFVYIGNVWGHKHESTYCPDCKSLLIKRLGFQILQNRLSKDKRCPDCGRLINIVI